MLSILHRRGVRRLWNTMPKVTTITRMRQRAAHLRRLLGDAQTGAALKERPLAEQLTVFQQIAKGRHDRRYTSSAFVNEVEAAVEQLLHVIYAPLDGGPMVMPRDAWQRLEWGPLLARVTTWLYGDDLISMADAARLLYGVTTVRQQDVVKVRYLIQTGRLRHYWDPDESNPTHASRVRWSAVLRVTEPHRDDDSAAR